jgi:hypothetical protein
LFINLPSPAVFATALGRQHLQAENFEKNPNIFFRLVLNSPIQSSYN